MSGAVRRDAGSAFLSLGFRPLFLAASAWAAVAVALWLAALAGWIDLPTAVGPTRWHAHEMVFGFALAAVGGFLLTAIPSWTGRAPVRGAMLGALAGAWLAGRVGVGISDAIGAAAVALADLAYPTLLAAIVLREIAAAGNRRNLPVAGIAALLAFANLLVHLETLGLSATGGLGFRLAIATLALLVSVIGGRIVPAFTRNWLAARGDVDGPAPADRLDRLAVALTALAGAAWAAAPDRPETGALALLAGIGHLARLARWRGPRTLGDPLLWELHLGYLWLALGFVLIGATLLVPGLPPGAALHALTAGAFGTMILAVMSRVSLGHSGRVPRAGSGTVVAYVAVTAAALLRVGAPFAEGAGPALMFASGLFWAAGYGLFAVLYLPVFLRPRVDSPDTVSGAR